MKRTTPLKRKKPLRRISHHRKVELAEYKIQRLAYLEKYWLCQITLAEEGYDWMTPPRQGFGWYYLPRPVKEGQARVWDAVAPGSFPRSTEIHHGAKRNGSNFLDTSTWWAACRKAHDKVELNKAWARSRGYLQA